MHALFALILAGSLAAKYLTTNPLAKSSIFEPRVIRVARMHGLTFGGYATVGDSDINALRFAALGCARPILVVLLWATFDYAPIATSTREPGYILRYIYIDSSWDRPQPLAVASQRVKYGVLYAIGLSPYRPTGDVLLLKFPSECRFADEIDWRNAWRR